MNQKLKFNRLAVLGILGFLSAVSPFSIDMYLPAFKTLAADLKTSTTVLSFSLSSYFIGLSCGQLWYGPLLDRFGRKKPLGLGLSLYIIACMGCASAHSIKWLVIWRFVQALGGCVASVASTAMVRDFFEASEAAQVFSVLMLILGVSPLLAPTVGSYVSSAFGWQGVFITLALVVFSILAACVFFLPEGHEPDPSVSLKIKPIIREFGVIFKNSQFRMYSVCGAFSFSGIFVYVAGSPLIFMDGFHVSAHLYGAIFALLSVGFIGGSQVNIFLSKNITPRRLFSMAVTTQVCLCLVFLLASHFHSLTLIPTLVFLFLILSCIGLTYPNAASLALTPFSKNAGSASALLGFLQTGIGALAASAIGFFGAANVSSIVGILFSTAAIGYLFLVLEGQDRRVAT